MFLNKTNCYFSGPIDYHTDQSYRQPVIDVLKSEFGINIFDPHSDPKQQYSSELTAAKSNGDWGKVSEIVRSFVRKDLCWVDRADFLIAYLPEQVPTCGTHHEIINSVNAKKPTLLVTNGTHSKDLTGIPSWYFGFIPHEVMFGTFEGLFEYLREVNSGLHKNNNRWQYVYGLI